ncbi:uroporphyrinogen-III C-methyltransferase [Pasteurella sp. PK-2025]|uniref:uroporphyrinogen-III C-methyltransferase n=1 Tax=unclassified Pasteurella TaxID=2621516 RepID=UPI003C714039
MTSSASNEVPKHDANIVNMKADSENNTQRENTTPESSSPSTKSASTKEQKTQVTPEPVTKPAANKSKPEATAAENVLPKTETVVVKKGGSGLALLALLVALGLGGAGYYFGQQQVNEIHQKMTALETKLAQQTQAQAVDLPSFDQERKQLSQLMETTASSNEKLAQLQNELSIKEQAISGLQIQINRLASAAKQAQPNDWLLSEADFLLNNALRKLILDNDVDTSISLLKLADEVLTKVSDPRVISVRAALNNDLKQLLDVNNVDQNAIMQRLSQLTTMLDEMTVLDVNFADSDANSTQLSDSIQDWKENAEKSATSFLNHFIRITPRNVDDKALLAPNQDIYLRENIRLRLQIAIMAVPRQQDELYKQSLETVASWVRSYFDTNTDVAQTFLKNLDELAEQSIYIDAPSQLSSLNVLDKLLNRQPQDVQKIEISVDKALTETPTQNPPEKATEAPAQPVPQQ